MALFYALRFLFCVFTKAVALFPGIYCCLYINSCLGCNSKVVIAWALL